MKKIQMLGFSVYTLISNGSEIVKVVDVNGKVLKPNKKGDYAFVASEDVPEYNIEAGKKYTYGAEQLQASYFANGAGEDYNETPEAAEANNTDAAEAPKEKTEAQMKAEERRKKISEFKKKIDEIVGRLIASTDPEETMKIKGELDAANKEREDYEAANPVGKPEAKPLTDEEKAELEKYDGLDAEFKEAKAIYEELRAERAEMRKLELIRKNRKETKESSEDVPQRAPKLSYEQAQEIRKMVSEGIEPAKIAEHFGCTTAAVHYKAKYLQHKLRKGDTAFTPLVNEYYPALGDPNNETGTDGAPYAEDGIKETAARYVKAGNRNAPAVSKKAAAETAETATEA